MKPLKLGIIGLDTSHVVGLAETFNDPNSAKALPGARIEVAFPAGSPDFPSSANRLALYTDKLRDEYGVRMVDSAKAVAEEVDAVLLTSVDGRVHLAQFSEIAAFRRPTFLDKPFALTTADARAIRDLSVKHGTPLFGCSSLRFAPELTSAIADTETGDRIIGADFAGPMAWNPPQTGYFWYGVHAVEMIYTALGVGCHSVTVTSNENHDVLVGLWKDGRIGVARGNRAGNNAFAGRLCREKGYQPIDVKTTSTAAHDLAKAILAFFQGGPTPVSLDETVELTRFLEAANESRDCGGKTVVL